ncbi:CCA tRNA nucleotidyltransferase, mitochondrial [Lambiella insularis]|nr:CCA tRNA nucleotidyltransferase, mitochondrial [Lambiella insularis]
MRTISLTPQEEILRQLLLDVSNYIGMQDGCVTPQLRFTGGWVRDKLLNVTSKDIDIGIDSMTGYKFGTMMKQYLDDPAIRIKYGEDVLGGLAKIEANPEKSKHLETVTTKILGLDIDLVNLRKETYVEESRNPAMEFGTPEEDALRRDSTVNALFYNLNTSEVEDLTHRGLQDMGLGVIRTPLPPYQTFRDDPLRVLRCIRFASRLGYSIDQEAEDSMSDQSIKDALRAKISRERIGIEIEKMLKGPQPRHALALIDRLALYNTVFTDPNQSSQLIVDTTSWSKSYHQLSQITGYVHTSASTLGSLQTVKKILVNDDHDLYLAWLLCALTPWAKTENPAIQKPGAKRNPPMAAVVAREGLKVENRSTNVIKDAMVHLPEIVASKAAISTESQSVSIPMKRKQASLSREGLGMAIRRWGRHWRSSVLVALLTEVMEAKEELEQDQIVEQYAAWLTLIESLCLLDAYALKPIVDGKQLLRVFNRASGPWMVIALDIAMEWQLRNPGKNSPEVAIAEVKARQKELGID